MEARGPHKLYRTVITIGYSILVSRLANANHSTTQFHKLRWTNQSTSRLIVSNESIAWPDVQRDCRALAKHRNSIVFWKCSNLEIILGHSRT